MNLTKDQLRATAIDYLPREGGFATALAEAYLRADADNKAKIESVFLDLFERAYRKWGGEQ